REDTVVAHRLVVAAVGERAESGGVRPEEGVATLRAVQPLRWIAEERHVESMGAPELPGALRRVGEPVTGAVDVSHALERESGRRLHGLHVTTGIDGSEEEQPVADDREAAFGSAIMLRRAFGLHAAVDARKLWPAVLEGRWPRVPEG